MLSKLKESLKNPTKKSFDDPSFLQSADTLWERQKNVFVAEAYPEVKRMFIRRVYQILIIQLIITFGMIWGVHAWVDSSYPVDGTLNSPIGTDQPEPALTTVTTEEEKIITPQTAADRFIQENVGLVTTVMWSSILGGFGLLFALHLLKHSYPLNLVLLFAFTLCESFMLSFGLIAVPLNLILQALEITITVFIGLTLYTIYSKEDYSWMGSYLFSGLWILIFGGILQLFFPLGSFIDMLMTWGGAFLFCGFIIYDTWRLHYTLRVNEYIVACINLYLDFLNLFLKILKILAKLKGKD